jgi:hypothetical protein
MAKKEPPAPVPETLPQSGGRYIRTDTGELIPNPDVGSDSSDQNNQADIGGLEPAPQQE